MIWLLALAVLGGCQSFFGLDHVDPLKVDAALDAKIYMDAPPAGIVCAGVAGAPLHICAPMAMLQGVTYSTAIDINTDDDTMCTRVEPAQNRQHELCELIGTDLTIDAAGSITAHGSRPLVLVAMSTLTIAGVVDVSSHSGSNVIGAAADESSCTVKNGSVQGAGFNTSGGGAGGSFGSLGGAGGAPADGTALPASVGVDPTTLTLVRGGCIGGAGGTDHSLHTPAGGHSGGAVYLMGGASVSISGVVRANGSGGQGGASTIATDYAGGAGGGTGGLIMIDTPSLALSGGVLMANGGAGGAGCSDNAAAGGPGADPNPALPAVPAKGGTPTGDGTGGTGGNGSTQLPPQPGGFGDPSGMTHTGAGAGGGGGKGIIRVFGSAVVGGTIVPAAT